MIKKLLGVFTEVKIDLKNLSTKEFAFSKFYKRDLSKTQLIIKWNFPFN